MQVMLGGKNIEEGFGIAYRVIQVCLIGDLCCSLGDQGEALCAVLTFLTVSNVSLPQDFQLEAQAVYARAGQKLVRQRQYGAVRQLLKCVGESGTATKNECDALILSYISVADKAPADVSDEIILKMQTFTLQLQTHLYLFFGFILSRPKNWTVSFWRPKALKTRYL